MDKVSALPAQIAGNLSNMLGLQQQQFSKADAQPQQPNISTVPKKDPTTGKPIPGTIDGTLVRVRLFDDRERVLFFRDNANPTAKQAVQMLGDKMELQHDSHKLFSLWIVGKDLGKSVLLCSYDVFN